MTIRSLLLFLCVALLVGGALTVPEPSCARPDEPTASEPVPIEGRPVPPGMVPVSAPKNTFVMGVDDEAVEHFVLSYAGKDERRAREAREFFGPEAPAHEVTVRPFFADRFEVTAAQYLRFLESRMVVVKTTKALDTLNKVIDKEIGLAGGKNIQWRMAYALNWSKLNPKKKGDVPVDPKLREVEAEAAKRPDDLPRFEGGIPLDTWADRVLPPDIALKIYDRPVPDNWAEFGRPAPWATAYPITFVSLNEAREFADWAGKHVLLEPEWELAARGTDGNLRTWASPFKAYKKAKNELWEGNAEKRVRWAENIRELLHFDAKTFGPTDSPRQFHQREVPVGWFSKHGGQSAFGLEDMLGNVAEWTDTPFLSYPGAKKPISPNPFIDRLTEGREGRPYESTTWVVRGGNYGDQPFMLRTTVRIGGGGEHLMIEGNRFETVGFRCGRWPGPGADRAFMAWRALDRENKLPTIGQGRKTRPMAFDELGGLGIELTDYVEDDKDHVHVRSETRSIAIVPLRRLAVTGIVKSLKTELAKLERNDPDYRAVIGLLQTSVDLRVMRRGVKEPEAGAGDGDGDGDGDGEGEGDGEGGGKEKDDETPKPNGGERKPGRGDGAGAKGAGAKGGGAKGGKPAEDAEPAIVEEEVTIGPGRYVLAYHDRRILVLRAGVVPQPLGYLNLPSANEKDDVVEVGDAADAFAKALPGIGAEIVFPVLSHSARAKSSFLFRARIRVTRASDVTEKWNGTK